MINLLSAQTKREIRAARLNVVLVRYGTLIGSAIGFLVIVFGVGYIITSSERAAAQDELKQRQKEASAYQQTQKQAEDFSKNLATAKTILGNEIVYSKLLTKISGLMPAETILSTLNIDNATLKSGKPIILDGQAKNYGAILQLKTNLESSPLLEKVNITSITEKPNAPGQPAPTYPLNVRLDVTITKNSLASLGAN